MYYIDYHSHSCLSPDSEAPLFKMAEAAIKTGLAELCITDHYDLLGERGGSRPPYDWAPALRQFQETVDRLHGKLVLRLGLELGSAIIDSNYVTQSLLTQPELDFVIGSLHNQSPAAGGVDFYYLDYSTPEGCYSALDDYFSSMASLARQPELYDVLGHIIYPLRYMPNPVPLDGYMDQIESILMDTVHAGRGIELNTYRGRTLEDWRGVFTLYRALGGEIVTVGADAHVPSGVGQGIPEAYELLKDMGFRYISVFEKRKPRFIKL